MRIILLFILLFPFVGSSQLLYKGQPVLYKGDTLLQRNQQPGFNPTCFDGIQNGDETDVDCGGSCEPCSSQFATITVSPTSGTESIGVVNFTISIGSNAASDITVNYTVAGTATPTSDYSPMSGTAIISTGTSSEVVSTTIVDDGDVENNETIIVSLTSGTGYVVSSPSSATFIIQDNDNIVVTGDEVYIVATDPNATKSPTVTTGEFTIYSAQAVTSDLDVNYSAYGNAVNGTDYQTLSGVATILSGQSSTTITITPIDTDVLESSLAVILQIDPGTGYRPAETYGIKRSDNVIITNNKTENLPATVGTSTINNLGDFTNPANAGTRATVSTSFNASGQTAAAGMVLVAGGGIISGTNINLNGSGIEDGTSQLFSNTSSFSSPYTLSRLRPEIFGAAANGTTDDHVAVVTLIENVQHASASPGVGYAFNEDEIFITRSGLFDWNLSGASITCSSDANLSHGTAIDNGLDYMMNITQLDFRIYDGSLDGNVLASRMFWFRGAVSFYMESLSVLDFFTPPLAYAKAEPININPQSNFTNGYFLNSSVSNVRASSDFTANNVPFGVSKALNIEIDTNNPSAIWVLNNSFDGPFGDDAETIYTRPGFAGGGYNNATTQHEIFIENNTFRNADRRSLKINASNCKIRNNLFETVTYGPQFAGAQAQTIAIFPISPQSPLSGIEFIGNTVNGRGDSQNNIFYISESVDSDIINNIFNAPYISAQRYFSIGNAGNGAGSNSGFMDNTLVIDSNELNNVFLLTNKYVLIPSNDFKVSNMTINITFDRGFGASRGAITIGPATSPQSLNNMRFEDITINWNSVVSGGDFVSAIQSDDRSIFNTVFDNVNVNYTGTAPVPTYSFMLLGTNPGVSMDNTNTIIDCTMTGDSGVSSIGYTGSFGATITNSTGNGVALTAIPK